MSANEPLHDPADLLDELDAIIREQELLRHRTIALQGRYQSLEAHGARFDKPGKFEGLPEEYGGVNVEATARRLADAASDMALTLKYSFQPARKVAGLVREWPQTEPADVDRSPVEVPEGQRIARSSALADYQPGQALADRDESDRGDR